MNQLNSFMPPSVTPGYVRYRYVSDGLELIVDRASESQHEASSLSLYSAIALDESDHLLQCLSKWLGCDHNWAVESSMIADASVPCASIDYTLSEVGVNTINGIDTINGINTKIGTSTHIKKIGLISKQQSIPEFPEELKGVAALYAHNQALRVCLAELDLTEADQQRLGPGCCVLLPNTFTSSFSVNLVKGSEVVARAVLDRDSHGLKPQIGELATEQVAINQSGNNSSTVRFTLNDELLVNLPQWQVQSSASALTAPSLIGQKVVIEQEGSLSRRGQILRVEDGLAVLLESGV